MTRLEHVSADDLRDYLTSVEGKRATLRLVVGINYKEGVSQSRLAEWYGVSRTTVHNWLSRLERLEHEPLATVIHDAERSGRPRKLSGEQWDELMSILEQSPRHVGVDESNWSPRLVQSLIRRRYEVEYSQRRVREFLNEAGQT